MSNFEKANKYIQDRLNLTTFQEHWTIEFETAIDLIRIGSKEFKRHRFQFGELYPTVGGAAVPVSTLYTRSTEYSEGYYFVHCDGNTGLYFVKGVPIGETRTASVELPGSAWPSR